MKTISTMKILGLVAIGIFVFSAFSMILLNVTAPTNYTGNRCLNFDGKDDYARLSGFQETFRQQNLTIEAWIKPKYTIRWGSDALYGHATGIVVSYQVYDPHLYTGTGGWWLGFDYANGPLYFCWRYQSYFNWEYRAYHSNRGIWYNSSWYHVAVTFNPSLSSGNIKFYVNGTLDSQHNDSNTIRYYGNIPYQFGGSPSDNYGGLIDEVRTWKVSRKQSEIQGTLPRVLSSSECKNPNLIGYWRFDEGSGDTSKDYSKYLNDAVLALSPANPQWYSPGAPIIQVQVPTQIRFTLGPNPAIFGQSVTLVGNLTTTTKSPISGAKVTVKSNGTAVATLTTNSTGWFKITGTRWFKPSTITAYAGTFNITVSYAGSMQYLPSSYWQILTVKKATTEIYAKFSINPVAPGADSTLKGILVDQFGKPIKYAKVTLRYSNDYGSTWITIVTLTTSSYGTFSKTLTAPSAGTYIYRMKYAGSLNYLSSITDIPLIVR